MNDPEISVVMSVYNDRRYLNRAMESILTQSDADFEFVIINDGSADGSREILEDYARSDQRIRI
ncbi:MAG: glycosyltransferase, partial [Acidobacteriia bacterium]|nr:glycosyltransferase [Terriglobia bacterium]